MIESIDIVGAPPTSGGSPPTAAPGVFAGELQEAVAAAVLAGGPATEVTVPVPTPVPDPVVDAAAVVAAPIALADDGAAPDTVIAAASESPAPVAAEEPRITAPPGGCSCCLGITVTPVAVSTTTEAPLPAAAPVGPLAPATVAVADAVGADLGAVLPDDGTDESTAVEPETAAGTEPAMGDTIEDRPGEAADEAGRSTGVPAAIGSIVAGAAAGAPAPPTPATGTSTSTASVPSTTGITMLTGTPSGGDTAATEDDTSSPGSTSDLAGPADAAPGDRAVGIDQRVGSSAEPSVVGSGSSGQSSVERPGSTANAGVMRSDQVRVLREMAPNRELQRLAIDLDGARVSVRVDHDVAKVQVLSDPGQRLSGTWADDVQRTLNVTLRQDTGAQTQPDGGRRNRNPYQQVTTDQTADSEFSGRLDLARGV